MNIPDGHLPAITVWQPYADLIVSGIKRYETRSWSPPEQLIGRRLAIHAAKKDPTKGQHAADVADAMTLVPESRRHELPLGAVVAVATLAIAWQIRSAPISDHGQTVIIGPPGTSPDVVEPVTGDYQAGRWVWRLDNINAFEPVYCRGGQRIWYWKPHRPVI